MPGVRLGVEEREAIGLGVARGEGFAEIARRMAGPTLSVAREVSPTAAGSSTGHGWPSEHRWPGADGPRSPG